MLYIKDNTIKEASEIIVISDGFQIINPKHEQIIADGWSKYTIPEPTIEEIKKQKINEITEYDLSKEVNEFFVDEVSSWLTREERMSVNYSTTLEKEAGQENTNLWLNGIPLTLSCDIVLNLLAKVEQYAKACYNNTQSHKAAINALKTKESIENYNYKTGYPEKLKLTTK